MNLPCQFETVDLQTKKTSTGGNFLTINPKGMVPTLVLDNEEVLTENTVIQQYLAETHKATELLPAVGDMKRYHVLEWLSFVSADVHKSFAPLFNPNVPKELKEEILIPNLKKKMDFVDQHLSKNEFVAGQSFTLPDCYMFVMLMWLAHFKIDVAQWKNLQRYYNAVKDRPATQKALKEEGIAL